MSSDESFNEEVGESLSEDEMQLGPGQQVQPPSRYEKISDEKYELIIEGLERGETPGEIARWLKVKIRTVYSIRRRYEATGRRNRNPRGGKRAFKVNDGHMQELIDMLEGNPLLTLREMQQQLMDHHPGLEISTTSISRALDKQLITLKCLTRDADVPVARNSPENLVRRQEFADWLVGMPPACHMIYLDETGFNIWTRRSQGRSRRGQRVRRVVHTQRGAQVNIIQAVSPVLGLVYHEIIGETMTAIKFQASIEQLLRTVSSRPDVQADERFCIVMDGARFHNGAQIPQQFVHNWELKMLPPYSPFLNPVEEAHSCLKAAIKRQLGNPEMQQELDNPPPLVTLCQWRILLLHRIAEECTEEITAAKCGGWYRHMLRFIPICMAGEAVL